MSEKWEVVTKGGKHKQQSQLSTKEIKKIKENVLNGNRFNSRLDEETDESISPESIKIPSKNKAKSKIPLKTDGSGNLSQQINKLTGENVKSLHKELSDKLPTQHNSVLMDLALHLNVLLKVNEEVMKNISFDNIDFPYGLLATETKSALRNVFNGLNNAQLGSFLKMAMVQIVDDNEKGIKSVGLLILVQVCLKMKPTALIANRKSVFELVNMHREHLSKFKCLLWTLKQACVNFNVACQVWLIYVLPFISQRCHTETVLLFGEEVMNYPTDIGGNDSSLLPTDFLPLVDLVFNQTTEADAGVKKSKKKVSGTFQLAATHVDRLAAIYRRIKDQIFTSRATASLKDYVPSLFLRLSAKNTTADANKELLDCLDNCISLSLDSVKQLDQLYVGYPHQTKIFLDHFSTSKTAAASIVTKQKSYKATLEKVHSTNSAATVNCVQDAPRVPKSKRKSKSSSSCCGSLLKVMLYTIVMVSLVGWIVSNQFPDRYKLLCDKAKPVIDHVIGRINDGWRQSEPVITDIGTMIKTKSVAVWSHARPYVAKLVQHADLMGQYLYAKMNEVSPTMMEKMSVVMSAIEKSCFDAYVSAMQYLSSDQLQDTIRSTMDQVRVRYTSVVTYLFNIVGY